MKTYEYGSLENHSVVMGVRLKKGDLVGKGLEDKTGLYLGRVVNLRKEGVEIKNSKGQTIIPYSELSECITEQNVDLY